MVLLRHMVGDALRRLRLRQGRTLREVSASARVSLGYLSEVERGQKEASSELLAAICAALHAPLSQVLREVSDNFALAELQSEAVFADVIEPAIEVGAGVGRHGQDKAAEAGRTEARAMAATGAYRPRVSAAPARSAVTVARPQGRPVPAGSAPAGRKPTASPAAVAGAPRLAVPTSLPLGSGVPAGNPVFEQVNLTAREISDMVPV